jgi:membrane-associated protein
MSLFNATLDAVQQIPSISQEYGLFAYIILFCVIFLETGIVIFPFLPGDSIIFAAGALANGGGFNIWALFFTFSFAAAAGDSVNYMIGKYLGHKLTGEGSFSHLIEQEWLDRTNVFFKKYGAPAVVIGRFIPYARTFAPFLAGMGEMKYRRFLVWNVSGALLWSGVILFAGYHAGKIPQIKENLDLMMYAMIATGVIAVVLIICRIISVSLKKRKSS